MAKKDKTDRKSFEDMRAEREANVKSSLEAASDRMADAQGEAMLANTKRRTDELKGEKERVKNTAINVGSPQPSQNVEKADVPLNAGRVFDQGIAKIKYGMGHDVRKMAADEAVKAASDRMADEQSEAIIDNINDHIEIRKLKALIKQEEDKYDSLRSSWYETCKTYLQNGQFAEEELDSLISQTYPEIDGRELFDELLRAKECLVAGKEYKYQDIPTPTRGKDEPITVSPKSNPKDNKGKKDVVQGKAEARASAEVKENTEADMERMANEGRAARLPNYGGEENSIDIDGEAGRETRTEEQRGNASNKAGKPAPLVVHNAEERFQKNVEDVQGKLKYEPVLEIIRKYQEEQQRLADNRTPEQKKKAARREKVAKIIAALGDGIAAMSNLVLASKGAIPYQSKSMISKAVGDRYTQFRKDLEDRRAKYLSMSERINELSEGVRKAKDAEEQRKAAQALAQAELAYKQYKDTRDFNYNKEKDTRDFNYNKEKDDRQFNYNKGKDAADRKIRQQQADAATKNANANASRAATYKANGGGGTKYEFDGKTYGNVHAWGAAIKQKASQLGISLKEEYEAVDPLGFTRTHKRDKNIEQLLAEVNERMAGYSGFGF